MRMPSCTSIPTTGLLIALILIGLAEAEEACTPAPVAVVYQRRPTPLKATDYPRVLRTWSRSAHIYRRLENKLFITATFHAPELRRAFATSFPDIYGRGGPITRRELVDPSADAQKYHTFFMAMYTPDIHWNDLTKEDSIWNVSLRGHLQNSTEARADPAEIIPIKIDENLRAVYPYINRFDKAYLVRFPLTDPLHRSLIDASTTHFSLRLASALGVADMTWKVQPAFPP